MNFGELIKIRRIEKGLSINALAKKVGINPSYVMRLESSENKRPSYEIVMKLANELDISEGDVAKSFGFTDSNKKVLNYDFMQDRNISNIISTVLDIRKNQSVNIVSLEKIINSISNMIDNYYYIISSSFNGFLIIKLLFLDTSLFSYLEDILTNEFDNKDILVVKGTLISGDSIYELDEFLNLAAEVAELDEDYIKEIKKYYYKNLK